MKDRGISARLNVIQCQRTDFIVTPVRTSNLTHVVHFSTFFSLYFSLPLPPLSHTCTNVWKYFRHFSSQCFFFNCLHRLRILMTRLQNCEKRLLVLSCLYVRKQQLRSYRTDFRLIGDDFSENLLLKFKFH